MRMKARGVGPVQRPQQEGGAGAWTSGWWERVILQNGFQGTLVSVDKVPSGRTPGLVDTASHIPSGDTQCTAAHIRL